MKIDSTKIQLDRIRLYGFHGVSLEEQAVGSWFEIDVSLEVNTTEEDLASDNIERTVDYSKVLDIVESIFSVKSRLLEHLAYKISRKLCESFSSINTVSIRIQKLAPPVRTSVGCSAVELTVKA